MGVQRHDKDSGRDASPESQVEAVAANHPAQEQVEPFAGAAGGGTREEIADAGPLRHAPIGRREIQRQRPPRKALDGGTHIRGAGIVAFEKKTFNRFRAVDHLLHQPDQRDEIGATNPPVDDIVEFGCFPGRIESADILARVLAHHRDHSFDRLQDAGHTSKGERRGTEPDHFTIVRPFESPDDLNRIGRRIGIFEAGVQLVQRRLQSLNLQSALRPAQGTLSSSSFGGARDDPELVVARRCSGRP